MFEKNYSASPFLKKLAKFAYVASIVIAVLSALAALIILCINAKFMWTISLSLISIGGFGIIAALIIANLIWGFAEIIDNTKASDNSSSQLPPL